ncbi:uncharacterized protein LOC133305179 [Gastrolobium bilobum]|uniref:uncharacterized protein LOC133305179 n=1 Tax=Gastrolobium bilobum TaxID=150636 RepID=UPI002AAF98D3|nr:uncharacterized protein LOC133305179 [Gastrolobium bilobum]
MGVGRALGVRKLSLRFIGPYKILRRVGLVAYQLALPYQLSNLHDLFHVSQLRKYVADHSHVVQPDDVEIQKNLKTLVGPLKILERDEKRLRNKSIPMVKVQWEGRMPEKSTWERKDELLRQYLEFKDMCILDFTDKIAKRWGD